MCARLSDRRWKIAACLLIATTGLWQACNEHPVELSNSDGVYSYYPSPPSTEPEKVDILWVIDNSGSMCQEQEQLRERFDQFVDKFYAQNIDFNIGVTTTQADPFSPEPVAIPGRLQSEPQPIPGRYGGCLGDESNGFQPIRANIEAAIACTKDPSKWQHLTEVDDSEIACAKDSGCATKLADLFPTADANGASPYREIPKVLSASDPRYLDENGLVDKQKLKEDFACMSLVGTRGHYIEKGLQAVAMAVSPEMTGGTVENPTDPNAPNHGLLRQDAQFATIFLTDENDCSHDGSLEACISEVCEFANHPDFEDETPLIAPEDLAGEFIANLAASKGFENVDEFDRRSVVVASLHGEPTRYGGEAGYPATAPSTWNMCEPGDEFAVKTACSSDLGSAISGDRYARYMLDFDEDRIFPKPDGGRVPGLICTPQNFGTHMAGISQTIVGAVEQCITQKPRGCQGPSDNSCAGFAYGSGESQCTQFGSSSEYFCDSGLQVRMYPGEHSFADLQGHEYCVPESVDSPMTPSGCVIKPSLYGFGTCAAYDDGIKLTWQEDGEPGEGRWFEKLRGYELEVVVAAASPTAR